MASMELADGVSPREEFAALVTEHSRSMFRAARSLLDCDADAEDAVSEAVLWAWRKWGRLLDLYPDRTVEDDSALASVYATDVVFIGTSGERYPAQMLSDGTGAWACNAPQEETITAVEIGSLRLTRIYLDDGGQRETVPVTYGDLNWLIPVA